MYESFFELKKKPFELVPDPEFIYLSRSHRRALTYLDYGIRERAGFILLTGEIGSGKTTLIRDLLKKKYDKVVLAKIFNTRATSEQLLAMINDDFGLPVSGKDKITLMRELNDFLLDQYARGKQPILIIDEAQNLSADLLEEIRMLSNLESSHRKLLQIMLVGQPELRETLSTPELMQLRQRISINCHLKALSREETAEYIAHRMTVAGNAEALRFPAETVDIIHRCSRGVPRLVNIACDFIFLSAFAEEVRSVPVEMVHDIMGDLDFESHYWGTDEPQPEPTRQPAAEERSGEYLEVLTQLVQRVEAMEDFCRKVPSTLESVRDSFALLKDELSSRLARSEALFHDLSGRVSMVVQEQERRELAPVERTGAGVGFVRRLFGGVGTH
jgi:general secretion pathway protein A